MVVRAGQRAEPGFLPVFSVTAEEEARSLIVLCCPTNGRGEYVAPELVVEQNLENLAKFADRVERAHEMLRERGHCACDPTANAGYHLGRFA